jgi:hypothetical protein
MKTLQNFTYGKEELTVVVTELDEKKAAVEYFINGIQISDWESIKPVFQNLLIAASDDVCNNLGLTKWSY